MIHAGKDCQFDHMYLKTTHLLGYSFPFGANRVTYILTVTITKSTMGQSIINK